MKKFLLCFIVSLSQAFAQHNHPQHKMIMYGENEIFMSHVVYKVPHNYQVILNVDLDEQSKAEYLKEKRIHKDDTFLFILDHMDISTIYDVSHLTGTLVRESIMFGRFEIAKKVRLDDENFKILYFNELPTHL